MEASSELESTNVTTLNVYICCPKKLKHRKSTLRTAVLPSVLVTSCIASDINIENLIIAARLAYLVIRLDYLK